MKATGGATILRNTDKSPDRYLTPRSFGWCEPTKHKGQKTSWNREVVTIGAKLGSNQGRFNNHDHTKGPQIFEPTDHSPNTNTCVGQRFKQKRRKYLAAKDIVREGPEISGQQGRASEHAAAKQAARH